MSFRHGNLFTTAGSCPARLSGKCRDSCTARIFFCKDRNPPAPAALLHFANKNTQLEMSLTDFRVNVFLYVAICTLLFILMCIFLYSVSLSHYPLQPPGLIYICFILLSWLTGPFPPLHHSTTPPLYYYSTTLHYSTVPRHAICQVLLPTLARGFFVITQPLEWSGVWSGVCCGVEWDVSGGK